METEELGEGWGWGEQGAHRVWVIARDTQCRGRMCPPGLSEHPRAKGGESIWLSFHPICNHALLVGWVRRHGKEDTSSRGGDNSKGTEMPGAVGNRATKEWHERKNQRPPKDAQ